jgi:hypothetical protein
MVWGAFWDDGRSNLYIMDRDFESAKHGYSGNSYLEVLDCQLKERTRLQNKVGLRSGIYKHR